MNSGNLTVNWDQLKDPLCYLCLHGTEASSLSLMQQVVGLRLKALFSQNVFDKFCRFYRIHLRKTQLFMKTMFCVHHASLNQFSVRIRGGLLQCAFLILEDLCPFLWGHGYPWFGLLVTPARGFNARVDLSLLCFLACMLSPRFTFGVTPVGLLMASMVAGHVPCMHFSAEVPG